MKFYPRLLLVASTCVLTATLGATTITFDTASDYTNNFTPKFTSNSGAAVVFSPTRLDSLSKFDSSKSTASFVLFNTQAASTSFTMSADVTLTPSTGANTGYAAAGSLSFGFLTNIGTDNGYAALFRFTGTNTADLRIFKGVNATTGALGSVDPVNSATTITLANSATWGADTYYRLSLDVLNTTSAISFTGSVLTTGNTVLGTFTTYIDNTPVSVSNTTVGFRAGVGPSDVVRIDNFSIPTSAIPEPSTYALLGGASVLGLAFLTRRQRR